MNKFTALYIYGTKFKFILKYSTEHFTMALYLNLNFAVKKIEWISRGFCLLFALLCRMQKYSENLTQTLNKFTALYIYGTKFKFISK